VSDHDPLNAVSLQGKPPRALQRSAGLTRGGLGPWGLVDVGLRYRKSVKIGGVRLNLNKRGVSASAGSRGARYTVNSAGRRTSTVGLPGSGLRYQTQSGGASKAKTRRAPVRAATSTPPDSAHLTPQPKPGLFAPKPQKLLWRALQQAVAHAPSQSWLPVMSQVRQTTPSLGLAADTLAGVLGHAISAADRVAVLSSVYFSGLDPAADPFVRTYASQVCVGVSFSGVTTSLPLGRELVGLLLCSVLETLSDHQQALNVANGLPDSPVVRLLRGRLLVQTGRPGGALQLTEGVTNTDDVAVLLLTTRSAALRALQHPQAAIEACREALRYPSRAAGPRHQARLERARGHLELGQTDKARADIEKVLAEDGNADGLQELLHRL